MLGEEDPVCDFIVRFFPWRGIVLGRHRAAADAYCGKPILRARSV